MTVVAHADEVAVTLVVDDVGTATDTGDVTAVFDLDDETVATGVGDVGTGTSAGDMTAVSDAGDVALMTGVDETGTGIKAGDVTCDVRCKSGENGDKREYMPAVHLGDLASVTWGRGQRW